MPLTALKTKDGQEIPLDQIDITKTVEQFGLPPADVAAIIFDARHGRKEVRPDQVTASQAGNGARQLYLEETLDYAVQPSRRIAALRGTMKHALSNVAYDGLVVEQRVESNSGMVSAKFDSFIPETGVLRDAKYPNVFKVIMILKHGVEKQARDYVLQLNVTALILRQQGHKVNELWLDFSPSGVGKAEKEELERKYGITDPAFIPVAVPFLPEAEVWQVYEQLHRAKGKAHKTGEVPPLCTTEQTWGGKKCAELPGGDSWCPVAEQCHALAMQRGEAHPRDKAKAVA